MYENAPPALMSMAMSRYDNNNQHDDYADSMNTDVEPPFDLSMVTNSIPYYDLPAGLMCLLVKVTVVWCRSRASTCELACLGRGL